MHKYNSFNFRLTVIILVLLILPLKSFSQLDTQDVKQKKKLSFAGVPLVNYNRSLGFMIGAMGSMYYKVSEKDTISPSSTTMLIGIYSTSNTYMIGGVQQLYLNEDRWRATFFIGTGDVFFQFYQGFGQIKDGAGIWVDFNSTMKFMSLDIKRKLVKNLYLGLEATFTSSITKFDIKNPITDEYISTSADMNSLGYNFLYDSRDNVNSPSSGYFIQFKNNFTREAFGSTEDFNNYELAFNNFWDIKKNGKSILVSRLFANIASGDVPFSGENIIGQDDLRGYSEGRYRGSQVYALQAELRQNIYRKFGMIGFLGFGFAVDEINEIPDSDLLPSFGIGLRYLMIPDEGINIGIDVGVGKEDWSLSFRIGETFGR
jgi:outer membrane protein assembly factor BamA